MGDPGLNTRETALVAWLVVFLVFVLRKPDVRNSLGVVFKTLFGSFFLAGVIFVATAYSATAIMLLNHFGYWTSEMTKLAVLWFVGFALVAMFNTQHTDAGYYRRLVLHNLGLAAVVEFVTNLHTFPLPVELLFVPVTFLLVMTQVVAQSKEEYKAIRKLIAWCLGLLGFAAISFSIAHVISHFHDVVTAERLKVFGLPLVLTAWFVPFLVGLRYAVVWHTMLHMIHYGLRDNEPLYRFTRRGIIRACGVSLAKVQLFESDYRGRLFGATTEAEVTRVFHDFRRAWAKGRRVRVQYHELAPLDSA